MEKTCQTWKKERRTSCIITSNLIAVFELIERYECPDEISNMLFSRLLFHVSKNKVMYNRCREWDINNITLLISRPIIKFNIPFYFSNYPSSFHRWLNSRRKIFSFQSFLTRLRSSSLDFYYFLTLFFFFLFYLYLFHLSLPSYFNTYIIRSPFLSISLIKSIQFLHTIIRKESYTMLVHLDIYYTSICFDNRECK